jgi:hypothetical protein
MKMKKEKSKVFKVLWRDVAGLGLPNKAWYSKEEMEEMGKAMFNLEYVTIGEIVIDEKDYIVMAPTTDQDGVYSDCSMIPKSNIIKKICLK